MKLRFLSVLITLALSGCFTKEVVVVKHLPIPGFLLQPCTLPEALPEDKVLSVRDLLVEMQVRQGDHIECAKKMDHIIEREKKLTESGK